jgi:hypothetical protein
LANSAESADQTIPKIAIHPIGQTCSHPTERDDRARIKFVNPHLVCEEAKQCGLRVFERVDFSWPITISNASLAVHPDAKPGAHSNKRERHEKHRLNQASDLELHNFAGEIRMQPWPCRGEHDAEENCAKREHD